MNRAEIYIVVARVVFGEEHRFFYYSYYSFSMSLGDIGNLLQAFTHASEILPQRA